MIRRLLAFFIVPGLLAAAPGGLPAQLSDAATAYYAKLHDVSLYTGRDTTMEYYTRLVDDQDLLKEPAPEGYDEPTWEVSTHGIATLDLSLVQQLMTRTVVPMGSIRGVGETLVKSSQDGTMQPVAVYVPASYTPGSGAPLIVFLHGNPQSESQLLAPAFVHALAESTHAILIAPYGRGYYDFRDSAADVYDALDAAKAAFTIDPRKKYLAGYSMGGFSVFEVAPKRPDEWTAVMCISGGLLGHDARDVVTRMRNTPFYVLTGARDESIPTEVPTITASYLSSQGIPVSFYSLPTGVHRLVTLLPILRVAWDDMVRSVIRSAPPPWGGVALPAQPMGAQTKT